MALTDEQADLLLSLDLPTDFSSLSDEEYFQIDDAVSEEMLLRGVNAAGDGLNAYGELCRSVIIALPDE